MLHELLLSLHGHPSPLLSDDPPESVTSLCSPTELCLLRSLTSLGTLQSEIRARCAALSTPEQTQRATIVPALAAKILDGPLSSFQLHVRDVEQSILREDSSLVGAYRAVPLASIVAKFDSWERVLVWLRDIVRLMQGEVEGKVIGQGGTQPGAKVLDHLLKETRTGYPDIESVCQGLLEVGEAAWIRQLVGWLLYGQLPDVGADDFFIHGQAETSTNTGFQIKHGLLPGFVTPAAAASILFIGRSIRYVQNHLLQHPYARMQMDINALRVEHLKQLTAMPVPIVPAALARTMAAVRVSLARNALQKLVPITTIQHFLRVLREFFLLERGEFAMALITVADAHLGSRSNTNTKTRDPRVLSGALIKEAELSTILNKTWMALTSLQPELPDYMEDQVDDTLDTARDTVNLVLRKQQTMKSTDDSSSLINGGLFDDMLLGVPTALNMAASPPLDMFLAPPEIYVYTQIHAYLLAIRRTQLHLTNLATLSVLRRLHPAPCGPPVSSKVVDALATARNRNMERTKHLRCTWAVVQETILVLSEMSTYFQGEVVVGSWATFDAWMLSEQPSKHTTGMKHSTDSDPKPRLNSPNEHHNSKQDLLQVTEGAGPSISYPHDPATLRSAHRRFLRALANSLLLYDVAATRGLRDVLARAEHLVALMHRLSVVVQALTAAEAIADAANGSEDSVISEHLVREEKAIGESLHEAEGQLRKSLRQLLGRLRQVNNDQLQEVTAQLAISEEGSDETAEGRIAGEEDSGFSPWKGPGLGRLLMRLEMANISGLRNESRATLI